ncbi:hypothetical protein ACFLU5_00855 [Bacteroidota bacterium]
MSNSYKSDNQILEKLHSLERRLDKIEEFLEVDKTNLITSQQKSSPLKDESAINDKGHDHESENIFESKIVEYGLAWFGSIVFLFGVIFLMTYLRSLGYQVIASTAGYIATFGVFIAAYLLKKPFPKLVYVLKLSGYLLIYYITLHLHFFSTSPLISSKGISLLLLLVVISIQLYFAIRSKSEFTTSLAVILMLLTAIFYDNTYVTLSIFTLTSVVALVLFVRFNWWRVLLFTLFLVYISHLIWFLGNPIMGHPMAAVEEHQNNLIFLFSYVVIFSSTIFLANKSKLSDNVVAAISIWNAITFTLILLLEVLRFYEENYVWIFGFITIVCLLFSVFLKSRSEREFAPAFYACFGFMALSVAVYGMMNLPQAYLYLALQSLLVVSMALWFRSKLIVVVNAFLYFLILILYLATSPSIDNINLTFAFVALATGRILNWKKERLTLKTEVLRNLYLLAAFIMVLYTLNYAVQTQYVTLSWTIAAIGYFILSIALHNIKYRWMSILTFFVAGIRLFLADLDQMEVGYRVIAFLFFAIISISVSIYYTKRIKKKRHGSDTG